MVCIIKQLFHFIKSIGNNIHATEAAVLSDGLKSNTTLTTLNLCCKHTKQQRTWMTPVSSPLFISHCVHRELYWRKRGKIFVWRIEDKHNTHSTQSLEWKTSETAHKLHPSTIYSFLFSSTQQGMTLETEWRHWLLQWNQTQHPLHQIWSCRILFMKLKGKTKQVMMKGEVVWKNCEGSANGMYNNEGWLTHIVMDDKT